MLLHLSHRPPPGQPLSAPAGAAQRPAEYLVNSAQVVVNRESAFSGALIRWTAWIDGQKGGHRCQRRFSHRDVTPGRHTIMIGPVKVPEMTEAEGQLVSQQVLNSLALPEQIIAVAGSLPECR